jgi:hypothetical protein
MTPDLQTLPSKDLCRCVVYPPNGTYRIALPTCLACLGTGRRDSSREKTIAKNRARRQPTPDEFAAFTGAHCKNIYQGLSASWRCPSCERSKYELLRWTMLYPNSPHKHEGWAAGVHEHHDHGAEATWVAGRLLYGGQPQRFLPTVVCEQCNSADASAKKKLKLPSSFSFSPVEIGRFVVATPHGWHLINYGIAQQIYHQVSQRTITPLWPRVP